MTVTRDDLEHQLREIESAVESTTRDWSRWLIAGLAVTAAVVIGIRVLRLRSRPVTVEVYKSS